MYWDKCYVCLFVLLAGLLSVGLGIEQDGQSELFYAMFFTFVPAKLCGFSLYMVIYEH